MNVSWPKALDAIHRGDLVPALEARQLNPEGLLADYFFGRCLAEAGARLDEAITYLRRARRTAPANSLVVQALALALARRATVEAKREALEIWDKHGLPHDLDLLGQVALTLESQLRSWPTHSAMGEIPWPQGLPPLQATTVPPSPVRRESGVGVISNSAQPSGLPSPSELSPQSSIFSPQSSKQRVEDEESDKMALAPVTKSAGFINRFMGRRTLSRHVRQLENNLMNHHPVEVLRQAGNLLEKGLESGDLHLLAGLAAEETGDPDRARAHLARAEQLNPSGLLARAILGRVYWRYGWFDLALALWRSLPVEGPYDHGRHYHLALAHDALGDRPAAFQAMSVALRQFYPDTFHFYLKRALWRWAGQKASG